MTYPVRAYSGFNGMKLGVSHIPPGWGASPLQGYPPGFPDIYHYPFLIKGGERHSEMIEVLKDQHYTTVTQPGLKLAPLHLGSCTRN